MSFGTYDSVLESCAATGDIDLQAWPSVLSPLIERLNHIAHNEFPIPRPYPILNPVLPSQRSVDQDRFAENSHIPPANTPNTPRTLPPVPPFAGSPASSVVPDSQPPSVESKEGRNEEVQLPVEVLQLLEQSLKTLRTSFSEVPPHTIQRLSELALHPTRHYRTLPAWLRALDRVVSVSSGADIFPLSDVPPNIGVSNGILHGPISAEGLSIPGSSNDTRNGYDRDSLGSDESLGGALLTPIPWLKDIDSSSGTDSSTLDSSSKVESWQDQSPEEEMLPVSEDITPTADAAQAIAAVAQEQLEEGLIPERAGGAVTQGELIRMEQEAGVVPVPHEDIGRIGDEGIEIDEQGEHMPHATGPDLIGTIDMGKVGGEERQVRISSPPEEKAGSTGIPKHDPNDAQGVLSGGAPAKKEQDNTTSEPASSDDFVRVEKEDTKTNTNNMVSSGSDSDGDIVLVDADGATADAEREERADENGINVGADAADSSTQ
ncbi:hypothetical protein LTR64_006660 [Lithohypha guttulata]|uniref:uncharacterized protein n=1 Tax=Lithohypha guttulata TaxID=1690604 RepID=UPI002DDDEDB7|nr:hypothetical protein LTR51_004781 [Lithohypha guttulata]